MSLTEVLDNMCHVYGRRDVLPAFGEFDADPEEPTLCEGEPQWIERWPVATPGVLRCESTSNLCKYVTVTERYDPNREKMPRIYTLEACENALEKNVHQCPIVMGG